MRTENILKADNGNAACQDFETTTSFPRDLHVILLSVLKSDISTLPRIILINNIQQIPKCPQPVVKITHSVKIITAEI